MTAFGAVVRRFDPDNLHDRAFGHDRQPSVSGWLRRRAHAAPEHGGVALRRPSSVDCCGRAGRRRLGTSRVCGCECSPSPLLRRVGELCVGRLQVGQCARGVHDCWQSRADWSRRLMVRAMADLLDDISGQIKTRIRELRPCVDEADRLQRALDALNTVGATSVRPDGRRAQRARTTRPPATGSGRQQVPVAAAVIDYIRANPGATAGDVAKALGRRRSSIATRLTQLVKEGQLSKAKRGYTAP